MKKTNEELLQFFGLKVGDKIKVDSYYYPFIIVEDNGTIFVKRENCLSSWDYYDIGTLTDILLNYDYEIIKPKKKLGDMKCNEILCRKCPLREIDCTAKGKTLYEALENYKTFIVSIKAELDKEVEECEK